MIDVHCPHCGEPWDNDSFHEMQDWGQNLTYMEAAKKFKTLGCNLFHGKDTPCDSKVVDENAMIQTKVGMLFSDYPEEWCCDY